MIKSYNNYINRDKELIREKVEINISDLVNKVKDKTEEVKSTIVYSSMTTDGKPVKTKNEYYALFYIEKDGNERQYTIGYVRIKKSIKKKLEEDKIFIVYEYELIDVDPLLQGTKLEQYRLYKTKKGSEKLLGTKQINGYYLYSEKPSDINTLLERYGLIEEDKLESQTVETKDIKVGNVYEITSSKGGIIKLVVLGIKDGEISGRDFENKQDITNLKLKNVKNPKLISTIDEYIKPKLNKHYIDNWKKSKDFINLNKKEKIEFMNNKINILEKYRKYMNKMTNVKYNTTELEPDIINEINKLRNTISKVVNNIKVKIKKISGDVSNKPVEEIDDRTETKEEKDKKEKIKKTENKAKEVQPKNLGGTKPIEKEKKEPIDTVKEVPSEQLQKAQLVQAESKKYINKNETSK